MASQDFELGGVQPNPRAELVYEGIMLCKRENIDFVLAVGGGSVLDSAKAIAIAFVTMVISGICTAAVQNQHSGSDSARSYHTAGNRV